MRFLARETGVVIVAGFAKRADDGLVYNSAFAVSPKGPAVIHHKIQPYGDYEKAHFAPGPIATATFRVGGIEIGLLICFDVEFPEHVRRLALAGCDAIAVPTALPAASSSRYVAERVVPVRAFENRVTIAYADLAGADHRFRYAGLACIAAPDGTDLARAPADGRHLLLAELDTEAYAESRRLNPYLAELRQATPMPR